MQNAILFRKHLSFLTGFLILLTGGCQIEKPVSLPDLVTLPITEITSGTAVSGGNITWDGGAEIMARGICWSAKQNPTIADNITINGTGSGSFSSSLTGLINGTYFYVRAYATNSTGTAYGNEILFITPVTDVDGNVYATVIIGNQVWMTKNLMTTRYNDKTPIPNITENADWINVTSPGFCWYRNETTFKNYGALYNWYAVNTGKLCPTGWHVPIEAEWTALTDYLGGERYAGGKLKEQGIAHWISPNEGADDVFGFSALPGGYRSGLTSGSSRAMGYIGWWWAGTEYDLNWARNRTIAFDVSDIARGMGLKRNGYSVRCVKN